MSALSLLLDGVRHHDAWHERHMRRVLGLKACARMDALPARLGWAAQVANDTTADDGWLTQPGGERR